MSAGSPSPSSIPDDMIDKFVLSYLRSRGYARAEDVFRQTLSSAGLDELAHSVSIECHATMLKQVLHGVIQQQQSPDAYTEAFHALQDWIEGSLDMYRTELHAVLFPIFIHVFLDLVTKGFPYDAAAFMEQFKKDFEARHAREIQALHGLHYPEQIEGNTIAKRFRTYKVDIILSAYSHQLLLSFLQESKLFLLLKIINEHINLSIMHAKPLQGSGSVSMHQEITGLTPGEIDSVNNQEVEWGALEQIQNVIKDASFPAVSKPEPVTDLSHDMLVDQDSLLQTKKPQLDITSLPTVTSRIPLPPITPQLQARIISNLQARQKAPPAADSQPTICCYTFLNSADSVNCIRIAQEGDMVAAGYSDSSVRIWDLNNRDREPPYKKFIGHSGPIFSIDMSSDSRYCLSSSEDGTVRLWFIPDQLALVSYAGHNYPVWDVKFSPLDFYFVSGSHDRTARLWSTERIFPLRIFAGHISDVDCVAFHPNSNYVLTGSTDKSMRFWDIQSGNCCRIFRGHLAPVRSVAISPDGDLNGVVRVYDLGSAQFVCQFDGHTTSVTSLHWSVDGAQIASGSLDGSVRIWDFATANVMSSPGRSSNDQPKHHTFLTKSTPITTTRYTASNLLLVGGIFRP